MNELKFVVLKDPEAGAAPLVMGAELSESDSESVL